MDALRKLDRGQRIWTLLCKMNDRRLQAVSDHSHDLWMKRMYRIVRILDECDLN